MKVCPNCNHTNRSVAKYCRMCGFTLGDPNHDRSEISASTAHLLPLGLKIQDRYKVLRKIGESGIGRVYLGEDNSGRKYAIKQIREPHAEGEIEDYDVYIRNFQREAKILSSLPHPYLPIARDFIITPNDYLIVMDYIEGKTLSELLNESESPFPEKRVLLWTVQICDALSYLHEKKPPIIHRNIKPKNIIVKELRI